MDGKISIWFVHNWQQGCQSIIDMQTNEKRSPTQTVCADSTNVHCVLGELSLDVHALSFQRNVFFPIACQSIPQHNLKGEDVDRGGEAVSNSPVSATLEMVFRTLVLTMDIPVKMAFVFFEQNLQKSCLRQDLK